MYPICGIDFPQRARESVNFNYPVVVNTANLALNRTKHEQEAEKKGRVINDRTAWINSKNIEKVLNTLKDSGVKVPKLFKNFNHYVKPNGEILYDEIEQDIKRTLMVYSVLGEIIIETIQDLLIYVSTKVELKGTPFDGKEIVASLDNLKDGKMANISVAPSLQNTTFIPSGWDKNYPIIGGVYAQRNMPQDTQLADKLKEEALTAAEALNLDAATYSFRYNENGDYQFHNVDTNYVPGLEKIIAKILATKNEK